MHSLEVVPRWRDPQLQVSFDKMEANYFQFCWLESRFIFNMSKRWYIICQWKKKRKKRVDSGPAVKELRINIRCTCLYPGRIKAAESLFFYQDDSSWISYNDLDFVPVFSEDLAANDEDAEKACGGDKQCLYDAKTTGNLALAKTTLNINKANAKEVVILGMYTND